MRLEKRVEEHWEDLHCLWQNELPGRRRVRAVLAVRGEALRTRANVLIGHVAWRLVHQLLGRYTNNAHHMIGLCINIIQTSEMKRSN